MARVDINELTKVFEGDDRRRIRAVDNLSLVVKNKQWFVVTGPSGCGKTTLLRLIAGLEQPTTGDILIDGCSQAKIPPERRNIAMVFQEPSLYPHLSIFDNIGFGLKLRGCPAPEVRDRVHEAAQMLQIEECLSRKPMELSGGQRHRVALARALVRRPAVFLFDEPFANLDVPTREQVRRQLRQVCRSLESAVIYVTHDQSEALMMGDRLGVMKDGQILQADAPRVVYGHPAEIFVARFLGSPPMNICEGIITANGGDTIFTAKGWTLRLGTQTANKLASGTKVTMGVRPEDIVIADMNTSTEALHAGIEEVNELGSEKRAYLRIGNDAFIARWPAEVDLNTGRIGVIFKPGAIRFFDADTGKAFQ